MYAVALSGSVETRDIRERTDRFVLRVVSMESQRGTTKLERVRLSVKKGTGLKPAFDGAKSRKKSRNNDLVVHGLSLVVQRHGGHWPLGLHDDEGKARQ